LNGAFAHWTTKVYAPLGQALLPLMLALVVAGVLGNVLQTGPMFTTQPLKPDFKRMNPANAFRRIFSMRTLWELGKMAGKFLLLGAVCAVFAWKARGLAEAVVHVLPNRLAGLFRDMFVQTSLYVLLVLGLAAVVDLLFTRREYGKKMRMSRREVRDEMRRRDGDPAIKSKRRQQSRELLRKARSLARVHEADVVLTNPTHYAVALRYRPGKMVGPVVIAKGAGTLAAMIRRLAGRHQVPVMRIRRLPARSIVTATSTTPCPRRCMATLRRCTARCGSAREQWHEDALEPDVGRPPRPGAGSVGDRRAGGVVRAHPADAAGLPAGGEHQHGAADPAGDVLHRFAAEVLHVPNHPAVVHAVPVVAECIGDAPDPGRRAMRAG
jgi:flagellar biosynthesis protein FlhB